MSPVGPLVGEFGARGAPIRPGSRGHAGRFLWFGERRGQVSLALDLESGTPFGSQNLDEVDLNLDGGRPRRTAAGTALERSGGPPEPLQALVVEPDTGPVGELGESGGARAPGSLHLNQSQPLDLWSLTGKPYEQVDLDAFYPQPPGHRTRTLVSQPTGRQTLAELTQFGARKVTEAKGRARRAVQDQLSEEPFEEGSRRLVMADRRNRIRTPSATCRVT